MVNSFNYLNKNIFSLSIEFTSIIKEIKPRNIKSWQPDRLNYERDGISPHPRKYTKALRNAEVLFYRKELIDLADFKKNTLLNYKLQTALCFV